MRLLVDEPTQVSTANIGSKFKQASSSFLRLCSSNLSASASQNAQRAELQRTARLRFQFVGIRFTVCSASRVATHSFEDAIALGSDR